MYMYEIKNRYSVKRLIYILVPLWYNDVSYIIIYPDDIHVLHVTTCISYCKNRREIKKLYF